MKEIHDKLLVLLDALRSLTYAVSRHNPGIEANDLIALPTLTATMRNLGDDLKTLGIATLAVHDEKQIKNHLEGKNNGNTFKP